MEIEKFNVPIEKMRAPKATDETWYTLFDETKVPKSEKIVAHTQYYKE